MELSASLGGHSEPINDNPLATLTVCADRVESNSEEFDRVNLMQKDGGNAVQSIPFYKLFSYADSLDWFLMLIGALGAAVHGAAVPVFFIFFGKLIDTLGSPIVNLNDLSHEAAKYSLDFVYLSIAAMLSGWVEVSCWMYTGERQSGRIRVQYLDAMLRQDVGFFDTEITTGEIVVGISSDTILVQEAIGEKVCDIPPYHLRASSDIVSRIAVQKSCQNIGKSNCY
ncbi:hypothetical protein L7F22_009937 [Adiantum nelumboides]|nr:hypothetical protein [Adiantum nelumboides]MCO5556389.1 hypothetical protein [Adiantum nelumboides]